MAALRSAILEMINTAALAVGGVCLAAAVLAQAGRVVRAFDVLSHFALLWLLGGLVCALCGALAKGMARRRLLTVGALAFVAAVALMAPESLRRGSAPAAAGAAGRIRLIQFNAWELNREPTAAADWIAGQRPDIVAIEELTPALHAALVARGFHYQRGMTLSLAIFSRAAPAGEPFIVPLDDWPVLPEFARATFPAPGGDGTFSLVVTHLRWPTKHGAWDTTLRLAEFLNLYAPARLIVAGDFNLSPWSSALRRFDRRVGVERRDRGMPTWPARMLVDGLQLETPAYLPIDHVYAGADWRTVMVRRGPSMGSDHYPLVVDLALAPQARDPPSPAASGLGPGPRPERQAPSKGAGIPL